MAKRGGRRPGAGRPKGSKSTPQKLLLAERAREYTETALNVLVQIAKDEKESAGARVSAATALLDRGYGRPWQAPPYEPPAVLPAADVQAVQPAPSSVPVGENVFPIFDAEELRRRYGGVARQTPDPGGP
jgi:hypothetical protein